MDYHHGTAQRASARGGGCHILSVASSPTDAIIGDFVEFVDVDHVTALTLPIVCPCKVATIFPVDRFQTYTEASVAKAGQPESR